MKNFTKNIYLLLFLSIIGGNFNAQSVSVFNETSAGACNGTAILNNSSMYMSWNWTDDSLATIQNGGDTLANLCAGMYVLQYTDSSGTFNYSFNIGTDTATNNCNGFSASASATIDNGTCSGSATVSVSGGTAPYNYNWVNGATAQTISNLCAGSYTVTVSDANGCSVSASTYVSPDSSATSYPLTGYILASDESGSATCDGTAQVYISGGTPPYSYSHSNGNTSSNATGLCAGPYSVVIVDAMGDSISFGYLISTPANTVDNNTYQDSTVVGTASSDIIEECSIDYASVNSALIDSYNFYSADTVTVTWAITDPSGVTYVTETYYLGGGNGVYSIELSLNCSQKGVGDFLKASDQIYYNTELVSGVGVEEFKLFEVNAYPNPFSDQLTIEMDATNTYEVSIIDISGKIVFNQFIYADRATLYVGDLAHGQYILSVKNDQTLVTHILVK